MTNPPWSIARRLSSLLTLALTALWLVAVAVAVLVVSHETNEVFDSALQETAQRLVPLVIDDFGEDDAEPLVIEAEHEFAHHEEYLVYQVRDARGRVLLRSHDAPEAPFPAALQRGHDETNGWRFFTERYIPADLYVQVGEPLAHRREALYETMAGLIAPLALLVPLAGLVIFWTVRRALLPLADVRAALDARGGADLSPIPAEAMPQELAPIIADVNRLLTRLAKVIAAERALAANAAHELRTPVAAALAQTQRLAAELAAAPQRARADQIASTLRRLGDLVEKLLQLARAEAGIALSRDRVDVLPALKLVVEEFQRRSTVGTRLHWECGTHKCLFARIDIDAFGIVLRNLIDNALLHGAASGRVEISLDAAGLIHVMNDGPAVPPERLTRLTERFERAGAEVPGAGLGLAIVESIMAQAGGSLELHSPARGRRDGFEAILRLDLGERAEI
jgi:two-component system OmpR family sensor kinase